MKRFLLLPFVLAAWMMPEQAPAQALATCTVAGSTTTYPTGTACWGEPTNYQVTVYEAGICTSAPTDPTTTTALNVSACEVVFTNTSGSTITVSSTSGGVLSGTFTRPANGTYTHGYVKVDKDFVVTSNVDFGLGAVINGTSAGAGRFCATITGSSAGGGATSQCGAAAPAAGNLTVPLTDFDGGGGFDATASATFTGGSGTVTINAFLVTSSELLAAASGTVTRLFGVEQFGSPLTIDNSVTGMDLSFRVSTGMTLIDQGGNTLDFASGPFVVDITLFN